MSHQLELWLEEHHGKLRLVATNFDGVVTGGRFHKRPVKWTAAVQSLAIGLIEWAINSRQSPILQECVFPAPIHSPLRSLYELLRTNRQNPPFSKEIFGEDFRFHSLVDLIETAQGIRFRSTILHPVENLRIHNGELCDNVVSLESLKKRLVDQCKSPKSDSQVSGCDDSAPAGAGGDTRITDHDGQLARQLAAATLRISETDIFSDDALVIGLGKRIELVNRLRDAMTHASYGRSTLPQELRCLAQEKLNYAPDDWKKRVYRDFEPLNRAIQECQGAGLCYWPEFEREVSAAQSALAPTRDALLAVFNAPGVAPGQLADLVQSAIPKDLITTWLDIERRMVELGRTAERMLRARKDVGTRLNSTPAIS